MNLKNYKIPLLITTLIFLSNLIFYTSYRDGVLSLDYLLDILLFKSVLDSLIELQKILGLTSFTVLSLMLFNSSLLRIGFKNNFLIKFRSTYRELGVITFILVFIHFILFLIISYLSLKFLFPSLKNIWNLIINNFVNYPIILGIISLIILFIMFITSFDYIKRKIKSWRLLHKLIYIAYFLTIFHFILIEQNKNIRPFGKFQLMLGIITSFLIIISFCIYLCHKVYKYYFKYTK